jgi:hypothetical protein
MSAAINDGGPAFPVGYSNEADGPTVMPSKGMSLRDHFAGLAMQGLLAQSLGTAGGSDPMLGATYAYAMADEMLKARGTGSAS